MNWCITALIPKTILDGIGTTCASWKQLFIVQKYSSLAVIANFDAGDGGYEQMPHFVTRTAVLFCIHGYMWIVCLTVRLLVLDILLLQQSVDLEDLSSYSYKYVVLQPTMHAANQKQGMHASSCIQAKQPETRNVQVNNSKTKNGFCNIKLCAVSSYSSSRSQTCSRPSASAINCMDK